tara:strand:+ start:1348 stop:1551 length:204 start_codon:yes stop_codon:yes gene_type:complete
MDVIREDHRRELQQEIEKATIKFIKKRLETTLENIEVQKGQVLFDDIEKIEDCIKALENLITSQDEK